MAYKHYNKQKHVRMGYLWLICLNLTYVVICRDYPTECCINVGVESVCAVSQSTRVHCVWYGIVGQLLVIQLWPGSNRCPVMCISPAYLCNLVQFQVNLQ